LRSCTVAFDPPIFPLHRPSIVSNSLPRASAALNALFVNVMAISA
jgi:hypothetical protein